MTRKTHNYINSFRYIGLIFLVGNLSCNLRIQEDQMLQDDFFNLGQLIDDQSIRLSANKALLYKEAFIGDEYSDQLLLNEACKWAKELEIFKEADLNIPALAKSYRYSKYETDTGFLHKWKSIHPYETKVDELLVFKNDLNEPLIIKSTMKYGNYLYQTEKYFELNLNYNDDQVLLLNEYKIEGWKKLLRNDTTFYRLIGEIR